jgi:hypothetical protein
VVEKEFGRDRVIINSDQTICFPRQPYFLHLAQLIKVTGAAW